MKPEISDTEFGSITIGGVTYAHDILIRRSGEVCKRKKKLSKAVYGSAHTLSLDEAEYVYEEGAEVLLIGSGQDGRIELSAEAKAFFKEKGCKVELLPTPEAIRRWNQLGGKAIGLFHVTC